ncbi:MAG: hypothetical protein KAJ35_00710 [Thermoplasmata archaeon]|nr:hypothetical protein [Thermoplasmata archaeon]
MAREDSLIWMIITPILKWLKTRHSWFSIGGTFILLVGLAWMFGYQAEAFPAQDPYNEGNSNPHPGIPDDATQEILTVNGYASEGSSLDERFDLLGQTVWTMRITFSATDEPPARNYRFTNEADNFEITVTLPDGTTETKSDFASGSNSAAITFTFDWEEEGGKDWTEDGGNSVLVKVQCTDAGDQVPFFSPFSRREIADDGNDYTLVVDYSYTE